MSHAYRVSRAAWLVLDLNLWSLPSAQITVYGMLLQGKPVSSELRQNLAVLYSRYGSRECRVASVAFLSCTSIIGNRFRGPASV